MSKAPKDEADLRDECAARNKQSEATIRQHYGDSIGPRRRYAFEVRAGRIVQVEQ